MALSDPELELLRELLEDDPGADVWLQVGEELIRRSEWAAAAQVLSAGLEEHPDETVGWRHLARASLESGQVGMALSALEQVPFAPAEDAEGATVRMLALEQSGRADDAREAAEAILEVQGDDVVAASVIERLDRGDDPQPLVAPGRVPDPMISMERAERYIAVGRPDRAARVYRRILFHDADHIAARTSLQSLGGTAFGRHMTDDLSEELVDPSAAPPSLEMPEPQLQSMIADDEITEPRGLDALKAYARGSTTKKSLPDEFEVEDDERTDPFTLSDLAEKLGTEARSPKRRRRRRSLLNQ